MHLRRERKRIFRSRPALTPLALHRRDGTLQIFELSHPLDSNPNSSNTPLKLEHRHHMNPAWKIQANEKQLEKHTLTLSLKLEQLGAHNIKTHTNNKII
jgi:hypothetical protein